MADVDRPEDDRFWSIADASGTWIGCRILDTAYLSPSCDIRLWSDLSTVHIEWDNREKVFDGCAAWSAVRGSYQLPRQVFIAEVHSFHSRLMEQMGERVSKALAGAIPARVQIDLEGLQREHELRCRSIDAMLADPAVATDWESVLEAIQEIELGANRHQA